MTAPRQEPRKPKDGDKRKKGRTFPRAQASGTVSPQAIDRVTRALGSAADEVLPELVAEPRAMREELEGLRRGENVLPFRAPKREGPKP
jgi:hypothetical protein